MVLVGGLAVPRCEAAGGGALSGVVSGFAADVVARRRHLASQSSGLVCGRKDGEMPLLDVVEEVFAAVADCVVRLAVRSYLRARESVSVPNKNQPASEL